MDTAIINLHVRMRGVIVVSLSVCLSVSVSVYQIVANGKYFRCQGHDPWPQRTDGLIFFSVVKIFRTVQLDIVLIL